MDAGEIQAAAEHLARARLGGPITPLPGPGLIPETFEEGYRVQFALHEILTRRGFGPTVGHKIGCTTPVMQAYLDIDRPCAGEVFAAWTFEERATIRPAAHHNLGFEVEIAARLGAALPADGTPYDRGSVGFAVESLAGAFELVDERYDDRPTFPAALLTADDFFNVGAVLGAPQYEWRDLDLETLAGRLLVDGEVRGEGRGADILGHPLEALAWLANTRAGLGRPLEASDFVLLGSVVQTVHVAAPATLRAELEGLSVAQVDLVE